MVVFMNWNKNVDIESEGIKYTNRPLKSNAIKLALKQKNRNAE